MFFLIRSIFRLILENLTFIEVEENQNNQEEEGRHWYKQCWLKISGLNRKPDNDIGKGRGSADGSKQAFCLAGGETIIGQKPELGN